jgi:hypothetical protein
LIDPHDDSRTGFFVLLCFEQEVGAAQLNSGKKREKIGGRQEGADEHGQLPSHEKPFPDTLIHGLDCRRAS